MCFSGAPVLWMTLAVLSLMTPLSPPSQLYLSPSMLPTPGSVWFGDLLPSPSNLGLGKPQVQSQAGAEAIQPSNSPCPSQVDPRRELTGAGWGWGTFLLQMWQPQKGHVFYGEGGSSLGCYKPGGRDRRGSPGWGVSWSSSALPQSCLVTPGGISASVGLLTSSPCEMDGGRPRGLPWDSVIFRHLQMWNSLRKLK